MCVFPPKRTNLSPLPPPLPSLKKRKNVGAFVTGRQFAKRIRVVDNSLHGGWKQAGETHDQGEMNLGRTDNFKDAMVRPVYSGFFLSRL